MVLAVRCEPFACHSVFKKNLVNAMLSKDTDYRYIIKKTQESHTDNSNIVWEDTMIRGDYIITMHDRNTTQ